MFWTGKKKQLPKSPLELLPFELGHFRLNKELKKANGKFELHAQFTLYSTVLEIMYPGCQRLFQHGFRFLSNLYSDQREKPPEQSADCFDGTNPIVSTVKSVGLDFEQDG